MGKAEMIERYGIEYYEKFKAKAKENSYKRYHADIEAGRQRRRNNESKPHSLERRKRYVNNHREIYRINSRDRNRLKLKGLISDDMVVHHLKYHTDNDYENWMDDIMIMTEEEHREWHRLHPDFVASDNII